MYLLKGALLDSTPLIYLEVPLMPAQKLCRDQVKSTLLVAIKLPTVDCLEPWAQVPPPPLFARGPVLQLRVGRMQGAVFVCQSPSE